MLIGHGAHHSLVAALFDAFDNFLPGFSMCTPGAESAQVSASPHQGKADSGETFDHDTFEAGDSIQCAAKEAPFTEIRILIKRSAGVSAANLLGLWVILRVVAVASIALANASSVIHAPSKMIWSANPLACVLVLMVVPVPRRNLRSLQTRAL